MVPVWNRDKVSYLSVPLGYRMWQKKESKLELAASMIRQVMPEFHSKDHIIILCDSWYTLHDNALTQYITEELERNYVIDIKKDLSIRKTNLHCIYGEKNITKLPFKTDVSNVILYHHEHADGTGPFQKKWNETPLPARIIHLADTVGIIGNSIKSDDNRWDFICQYLSQKKDRLFDSECVNAFQKGLTKESFMSNIAK